MRPSCPRQCRGPKRTPSILYPCGRKDTGISVTFSSLCKGFNFGIFQRKFGQCQISQSWDFCYYFFFFVLNQICVWFLFTLLIVLIPEMNMFLPCMRSKHPLWWNLSLVVETEAAENSSTGESQAEVSLESLRKQSLGSGSVSQGYAILFKSVAPLCSLHHTSKNDSQYIRG